jgi:SAM-dependent methyltransferase
MELHATVTEDLALSDPIEPIDNPRPRPLQAGDSARSTSGRSQSSIRAQNDKSSPKQAVPDGLVAASAAAARNREPILAVLKRILPAHGLVLEIASGTGEHAVHFAAAMPHLTWQPTDRDPDARQSISAHRTSARLPNVLPPLELDASSPSWPVARADAVVAINMIHIAPWTAAEGLMAGAARTLPPGGVLYLYGPFKENRHHTAASNSSFDASLRARDPDWGVRDLGDVSDLAREHGLDLVERISMPANNLSLIFRSRAS